MPSSKKPASSEQVDGAKHVQTLERGSVGWAKLALD